jgi:hypothetical protein
VMGAITDFGKNAGVKAEKLPTEETSKKIEEELRALAPFDWASQVTGMLQPTP